MDNSLDQLFPDILRPLTLTVVLIMCSQSDRIRDCMKAWVRSRYSNQFSHGRLGKTYLISIELVSFMNKLFEGIWHIACTIELVEYGM